MTSADEPSGASTNPPATPADGVTPASQEVRTRRLAVVDNQGAERLVAKVVDDVMELRLDLPGQPARRRTGLLLFTTPEQENWSAGVGVQIWVEGNVAKELVWWAGEADHGEP